MKVFSHHLYEYRKGLRNLILHTTLAQHRPHIEARLSKHGVDYIVYPLSNGRINVFFGADECVEVIRRIGKDRLNDYTLQEDFMLGIMLGYDRLAQCRRYLLRYERQHDLPLGVRHGAWPAADLASASAAPPAPSTTRIGFTLMELLIVLGILGALASLLLSNYAVDRKETLNNSIVQSELSEIQRAFHRMNADCVLGQDDYKLVSRNGLAVLLREGLLPGWDSDKGKGWRGPYIQKESEREIDTSANSDNIGIAAQAPMSGGILEPVICTPYVDDEASLVDPAYYRVIAEVDADDDSNVVQLWAVGPDCPYAIVDPDNADDYADFMAYALKRQLLLED